MLDYIKKQLAVTHPTFEEQPVSDDTDKLVTEYAEIFQELDGISIEGLDEHRSRPMEIEIPIEDDIELDTVELNLMDGRLVDVPMDVTSTMESFNENMKTFDDFYQEACEAILPFMREDEYHLDERRKEYAKQNYDIYHEQMVQKELFGFDKFPITNTNVPTNIMRDFGPLYKDNEQRYMVKLPVLFETDKENNIMQSQLDALRVSKNIHVFEYFSNVLREKIYQETGYSIDDIWDYVTPKRVIVPTPKDNYELIVEFECEGIDTPIYEGWTYSRKPSARETNIMTYPHDSLDVMISKMNIMNKRDAFNVTTEPENQMTMPSRWDNHSFIQEAIDFGYPDETTEGANKNQPAQNVDTNTPPPSDPSAPTVSVDDTNADNMDQPNANTSDQNDTNQDTEETLSDNDVSKEIADKVSEEKDKQNDSVDANGDINIDDIDLDTQPDDTVSTDDTGFDNLDNSLNDLDTNSNNTNDTEMGDPSAMDINSMSIDDIMTQAAEKLKSMPIEQVKQFLIDGNGDIGASTDTGMDTMQTESYQQEGAIFITSNNVKRELDIALRECLGCLNDTSNFNNIVKKFKPAGKRLNHVLTKAINMKKVFNDEQINRLTYLNTLLLKLQTGLKPTSSSQETKAVEDLIKSFTAAAENVGKFVNTVPENK